MNDNRYFSLGKVIGKAWSDGKRFRIKWKILLRPVAILRF
jgi:hypothetical protein